MNVFESEIYLEALRQTARRLRASGGTVLVTGASGLIGSALIDCLLQANACCGASFRVLALGRNEEKLRSRFSYAPAGQIAFLAQDICAPIMCDIAPDYVVHAASNADPRTYALHPAETLLTNIRGTENVLRFCAEKNPAARVLLTSTFEVYGRKEHTDVYAETDIGVTDINAVRSCYPESKRCAEILTRCWAEEYGVQSVIARLSSVYGPTMAPNDSKAHAQFLRRALAGENVVLKSEGLQKRSYTYVLDAVDAILFLLFSEAAEGAYNVSNEYSVAAIRDVAETVAALAGVDVVFDLPDETERRGFSRPQNCVLENTRLRELGWSGRYPLREGLEETLAILRACGE